MIVAAHQPSYLPWLGYLDKLAKSDVFVVMDDLQYEAQNFQNRQRVKLNSGAAWLTVPLERGAQTDLIADKPVVDELRDPEWDEDGQEKPPYQLGDTVKHAKFGRGMVISLAGKGEDLKVTVSFPNVGKKQLVAKLAKLEKV